MKNAKFLVINIYIMMLLASCDPDYCGKYTIKNNTDSQISLMVFRGSDIVYPETIDSLNNGEAITIEAYYCQIGYPSHPYVPSIPFDSVFVIFDDTLKVSLLGESLSFSDSFLKEKSPLAIESWIETKTTKKGKTIHFEYEFTNWHYQKALEANGYDID